MMRKAKGEVLKQVYVAKDSQALVLGPFPSLNGLEHFKSLYNTGSQIVSMVSRVTDRTRSDIQSRHCD